MTIMRRADSSQGDKQYVPIPKPREAFTKQNQSETSPHSAHESKSEVPPDGDAGGHTWTWVQSLGDTESAAPEMDIKWPAYPEPLQSVTRQEASESESPQSKRRSITSYGTKRNRYKPSEPSTANPQGVSATKPSSTNEVLKVKWDSAKEKGSATSFFGIDPWDSDGEWPARGDALKHIHQKQKQAQAFVEQQEWKTFVDALPHPGRCASTETTKRIKSALEARGDSDPTIPTSGTFTQQAETGRRLDARDGQLTPDSMSESSGDTRHLAY